jgi:hypothetical protein
LGKERLLKFLGIRKKEGKERIHGVFQIGKEEFL